MPNDEICQLSLISSAGTRVSCPLCGKTVKAGYQHECKRVDETFYMRTWKIAGKRPAKPEVRTSAYS